MKNIIKTLTAAPSVIRWLTYQFIAICVGIIPIYLFVLVFGYIFSTAQYFARKSSKENLDFSNILDRIQNALEYRLDNAFFDLWRDDIWPFQTIRFAVFVLPALWVWGRKPLYRIYSFILNKVEEKGLWNRALFRWSIYQTAAVILFIYLVRAFMFFPWLYFWVTRYDFFRGDPRDSAAAWEYVSVFEQLPILWFPVFIIPAIWVWRVQLKPIGRFLNLI